MDASCMVRLAQKWQTVPEQNTCARSAPKASLIIAGKTRNKAAVEVKECEKVKYLEHVQVHVSLSASKRGDVQITLISPGGTRSVLIDKRPKDYSRLGFNDWPFLTVHMWEESPVGVWTLEVFNDGRAIVELKDWKLVFWGTETPPQPGAEVKYPPPVGAEVQPPTPAISQNLPQVPAIQPPPQPARPPVNIDRGMPAVPPVSVDLNNLLPGPTVGPPVEQQSANIGLMEHCSSQNGSEWCAACIKPHVLHIGRCIESCPVEGYFKAQIGQNFACVPCYYSCETCKGPNDYDCITCFGDANLEEESPTQKYCHNKSLVNRVFSSSRWYYVLSIGFMINFCVVVILVIYILRWRKRHRPLASVEGGLSSATANGVRKASSLLSKTALHNSSRYMPVQIKGDYKQTAGIPFHDYDSSTDDDQLYRKPYSDEK